MSPRSNVSIGNLFQKKKEKKIKEEKRKKEILANESHKQNWRKQIEIFRPARDTSHEDNNLETVVCR